MGQERSPDVPSASTVVVANLLANTASERTHPADIEKHYHHIGIGFLMKNLLPDPRLLKKLLVQLGHFTKHGLNDIFFALLLNLFQVFVERSHVLYESWLLNSIAFI